MRKLGLVQARGLGDIIIALPIARYFHDRGWHVVWPIDRTFLTSFAPAVDYVEFLPFDFTADAEGFLLTPMRLLKAAGCEKIIPLYSYLPGIAIADPVLFKSLKFDEYKYAITEVPFGEKWNLALQRNPEREQALYDRLVRKERYVVRQLSGSDCRLQCDDPRVQQAEQVIEIEPLTDSIFDWLLLLEKASGLLLIDSCFSNLVEQLGIRTPKTFVFRSDVRSTPVLRGEWKLRGTKPTALRR